VVSHVDNWAWTPLLDSSRNTWKTRVLATVHLEPNEERKIEVTLPEFGVAKVLRPTLHASLAPASPEADRGTRLIRVASWLVDYPSEGEEPHACPDHDPLEPGRYLDEPGADA
jgi:hypothetical protein